jgi:Rrf2 family nitric oxide-sensitive transcriptional repressor
MTPDGQPGGDGLEGGGCMIAGACRLRSTLSRALAAFLAVLDDATLADLVAEPVCWAMAARLGVELPGGP